MSNKSIISPISIDLGAKYTGVYSAHYEEYSPIENIEKSGKVYRLEKDAYTLLMTNRTSKRHQRRGYDRRQMVKRLFKLIWEKRFGLEWDKDIQQTTSFLFNRRGFTFLTEEYNEEVLKQFPEEAYEHLPDELKGIQRENAGYDFASALAGWTNEGKEKVEEIYKAISKEPKRTQERQVFFGRTKKLREYCEIREKGETIEEQPKAQIKLTRLSAWIWDEWQQNGVQGLDERFIARNADGSQTEWKSTTSYDLVTYLNEQDRDVACRIRDSLPDISKEKEEISRSIWNFRIENFKIEEQDFNQPEGPSKKDETEWKQLHIQHLAYALYKTLNELQSGGRHRSKYFEEVAKVLEGTEHTHGYLKNFCRKLQAGKYQGLDTEKLARLISHLSNLELKPLRNYFNDKKHSTGDRWDGEARLSDIFDRWILRQWRVDTEKDKHKKPEGSGDYQKLKKDWEQYKKEKRNTVIDFWLKTDPFFTIPPYQDNNNRRPPKCQSLILKSEFLDRKYPDWTVWLRELRELPAVADYLGDGDFEEQLKRLRSGKDKPYFQEGSTSKKLGARILQFIFDRVKINDPINLNEIYSHVKKWRQQQSTEQEKQTAKRELQKAIAESILPDEFTGTDYNDEGLLKQGTFLHLVYNYYKQRQRARDGRLFIHPQYRYIKNRGYEKTGRFDDEDCLLTYCNRKPRQKRYQSFYDVAGILQISPEQLQARIGYKNDNESDDALVSWLEQKRFHGLKSLCQKSADAQKEHRGELKTRMDSAIKGNQTNNPLYRLNARLQKLSGEIGKELFGEIEDKVLEQKTRKFRSAFSFAQIHNIVFKDRGGYSNTCPICSADNAHRMQSIEAPSDDGSGYSAKASRLPAIPTRLIDGAVMRMARIVGGKIAQDKWAKIECELKVGKRVRVPIITESNRFEFEPNLQEIKGKNLTDADKKKRSEDQRKLASDKDTRIREASLDICPYTGEALGNDDGDKDHIIPRSSRWGTLNDEANLIWASDRGNKEVKRDREFSLAELKPAYKHKQFGQRSDEEIEKWIEKTIWENGRFTFGRYRSFINLTPDQQKAFRHALFLKGNPLRRKVIEEIDNRTRTLVNGTQRYFAEVIANNLHKKARTISKQDLLSFDFFGVEAHPNTRGDGITELREKHEQTGWIAQEHSKEEGKKQAPYSHLIDAQLAFAIAADKHKNEGGLRLDIPASTVLWPKPMDKDTGEIFPETKTIFSSIQVEPEQMELQKLERRKAYTVETHHREMISKNKKPSINYQIHRDSIIKENFFPILKLKDGTFKKGFTCSNCVTFSAGHFSLLLENDFVRQTSINERYETWNILKKTCQQFLMKIGVAGANQQEEKIAKIIDSLTYQTIKQPLEKALTPKSKQPPKTVGEALERWPVHIHENNFKKDGVLLPVWYEWSKFYQYLSGAEKETNFQDFVKNCSLFVNKQPASGHNKVRKVFSLPVKSGIGSIRLERAAWDKTPIIQVVSGESLEKYGYDGKGRPHTIISKRSVPIKHYAGIPDRWQPEPLEWKKVPKEEIKLPDNLEKIEIKDAEIVNKDAGRCTARLTISSVKNLSLPQDTSSWTGKVICHENEEELEKAQKQDKKNNHHCLSSQYKWFDPPFALPKDRREVKITTSPDGKVIEFTVAKTRKPKDWLAG